MSFIPDIELSNMIENLNKLKNNAQSSINGNGNGSRPGAGGKPKNGKSYNLDNLKPLKVEVFSQINGNGKNFNPKEEQEYRNWIKNNNIEVDNNFNGKDYDYRGFWKENGNINVQQGQHFTDKYKLPNHPTFSNESIYFNESNKEQSGQWNKGIGGERYVPFEPNNKQEITEPSGNKREGEAGGLDDDHTAIPEPAQQSEREQNTIKINDNRKIDVASGNPINDKNKLTTDADLETVRSIISEAIKENVDPYTALAMSIQETGIGWAENPFHLQLRYQTGTENVIGESMRFLKEKMDYAKGLGKKTEADILQAWNGYGKLTPQSEYGTTKYYGIDVSKTPLDMNKNPVYGKRVIDIRDNIIKQNPELQKLIEQEIKNSPKVGSAGSPHGETDKFNLNNLKPITLDIPKSTWSIDKNKTEPVTKQPVPIIDKGTPTDYLKKFPLAPEQKTDVLQEHPEFKNKVAKLRPITLPTAEETIGTLKNIKEGKISPEAIPPPYTGEIKETQPEKSIKDIMTGEYSFWEKLQGKQIDDIVSHIQNKISTPDLTDTEMQSFGKNIAKTLIDIPKNLKDVANPLNPNPIDKLNKVFMVTPQIMLFNMATDTPFLKPTMDVFDKLINPTKKALDQIAPENDEITQQIKETILNGMTIALFSGIDTGIRGLPKAQYLKPVIDNAKIIINDLPPEARSYQNIQDIVNGETKKLLNQGAIEMPESSLYRTRRFIEENIKSNIEQFKPYEPEQVTLKGKPKVSLTPKTEGTELELTQPQIKEQIDRIDNLQKQAEQNKDEATYNTLAQEKKYWLDRSKGIATKPDIKVETPIGTETRVENLKPAVNVEGKIYTGETGQNHVNILEQNKIPEGERGFVTPEGQFLSRQEASNWVKENQPELKDIPDVLHTEQYNKALGLPEKATTTPETGVGQEIKPKVEETKQPYEMTREEYKKSRYKEYFEGQKGRDLSKEQKLEATGLSEEIHKMVVQQALSEGKTVPEEVLKDYPELVGQKETKGIETKKVEGKYPDTKFLPTTTVKLKDINFDIDRFQNRPTPFSEKTATAVAERFDPAQWEEPVLWRDPKDGKLYVLKGHSRLEGMKRREQADVPVKIVEDMNEAEAMNFAKILSNRSADPEDTIATINAYKRAKAQKYTAKQMKDTFDGDVDFLESIQNLNTKGDFINYLNQPSAAEFPYIKRFARWVGDLRKEYPDKLTNSHEQQIFNWLYKGEKKNIDIPKEDFNNLIESQLKNVDFDKSNALVLKKGEVTTGTHARGDTAETQKKIDDLIAQQKEARTPQEHQALQKEIDRLTEKVKEVTKTQADLFFQKPVEEDYGNKFVALKALQEEEKRLQERLKTADFKMDEMSEYDSVNRRLSEVRREMSRVEKLISQIKPQDLEPDQLKMFEKYKTWNAVKQAHLETLTETVNKSFPKIKTSLLSNEEIKQKLVEQGYKAFQSKEMDVLVPLGFTDPKTGEIYINKDKATLDTPIHEFGHIWNMWAKSQKPELWNEGIRLMSQDREFMDRIADEYPELSSKGKLLHGYSERLLDEALAHAIGTEGADMYWKDIKGKENATMSAKFKVWLGRLWDRIRSAFGLTTTDSLRNKTVQDFAKMVSKDLLAEKVISKMKGSDIYEGSKVAEDIGLPMQKDNKGNLIRSLIREGKTLKEATDIAEGRVEYKKEEAAPETKPATPRDIQQAVTKAEPVNRVKNVVGKVINVVDAMKSLNMKLGEETGANIVKAIHEPEAQGLVFDNAKSKILDTEFSGIEKDIIKRFTPEDINDINKIRGTAQSDKGQDLQNEAQQRLSKKYPAKNITDIINATKEASDYVFKYAKDNNVSLDYFEDYFYGNFKDPKLTKRFLDYWYSTEKYTKEKTIPTIADANAFGLELKNPNPIINIKSELQAVAHRVGLLKLRDDILRDKPNYAVSLAEAKGEQLKTWDTINDPVFKDMLFDPQYAKVVNNLLSTNKVTRNPLMKGLRQVTMLQQQVKFIGSLFHMGNMFKGSIAQDMLGQGEIDIFKSFKEIDKTDPVYKDYLQHGGGHGYSLEAQSRSQLSRIVNWGEEKLHIKPVLDKIVKTFPILEDKGKFIPLSPAQIEWMFDKYIPALKFEKFRTEVLDRQNKLGRELTSAEKINIIKRNQNFYGEMNERLYGRSGTVTTALRFLFAAPGYGEGNFRTMARSVMGDKSSIGFMVKSLIVTATAATIGNLVLGQRPAVESTRDIRDLFKIKTGLKDNRGDDIFIDMMTYDKDYWSVFGNIATLQPGKIAPELMARVTGATSSIMQSTADLSTLFTGGMVYDFKGKPIWYSTDALPTKTFKLFKREILDNQPISVSTILQSTDKGIGWIPAIFQTAIGLRPATSEKVKDEKRAINDIYTLQKEKIDVEGQIKNLDLIEAKKRADDFNRSTQNKIDKLVNDYGISLDSQKEIKKKLLINFDRMESNKKQPRTHEGTSIESQFAPVTPDIDKYQDAWTHIKSLKTQRASTQDRSRRDAIDEQIRQVLKGLGTIHRLNEWDDIENEQKDIELKIDLETDKAKIEEYKTRYEQLEARKKELKKTDEYKLIGKLNSEKSRLTKSEKKEIAR